MIDVTIKDFVPQPYVSVISNDARFSLTEVQARSLVRALAQVLEEPGVCRVRGTCALYPTNKVAYHDEGSADPTVVVTKREDEEKVLTVSSVEEAARLFGVESQIHRNAKTLFGTMKRDE